VRDILRDINEGNSPVRSRRSSATSTHSRQDPLDDFNPYVYFRFSISLRVIALQPTVLTQLRYAESSRPTHLISTRMSTEKISAPQPTKMFPRRRQYEPLSIHLGLLRCYIHPELVCGPAGAHEARLCYRGCIIPLHSYTIFSTDNAQLSRTSHQLLLTN